MKSSKQRRKEIKKRRTEKVLAAQKLKLQSGLPLGAVVADPSKIEMGNSYDPCPTYYEDYVYNCRNCGIESVWTAKQQKWWYEEAKGNIHSTAARCDECRLKIRKEKEAQQFHMLEMSIKEPHPNEAFFKKRF